ncbi:MAG: MotA/TolQ/ExbB proton channel family protein [Gammaproteobacteria bacterium]|nr:MotA/TolQ/ExbB proton channel family protein [Gammaproteobacteria bacterium]
MYDQLETLLGFLKSGGPILSVVLISSILLWILILERYWYFFIVYPEKLNDILKQWQKRHDHSSWYALRIRAGLLADISIESKQYLIPIQTITSVLPLIGLLGTVTGMITIFEVLNIYGTGNTRGMAAGISRALLPTIAGLFTALAGLYFSSDLRHRVKIQSEKAKDLLHV